MIVNLQKIEKGFRETKSGKTQEGTWIYGQSLNDDGTVKNESWKKFLVDQFDSEHIAAVERIGVGKKVELRMVKKGDFWNVDAVLEAGAGSPPPSEHQSGSPSPTPTATQAAAPSTAISSVNLQTTKDIALRQANKLIGAILKANEEIIGKPGKITVPLITQTVLGVAGDFEDYLNKEKEVVKESDASDLQNPPNHEDGDPGAWDDDIPF